MSTRLVIFPTPNPLPPLPQTPPPPPSLPSIPSSSSSSSSSTSSPPPSPSLASSFRPFSHSSPIPSLNSLSRPLSSSVSSISISIFTSPSPPSVDLLYANPSLFSSASASASTSCLPIPTSSLNALEPASNRLSTSSSYPSILPPPSPFYKHHSSTTTSNQHSRLHFYPPQTAATTTSSTHYGTNPGALFSVRNVNVDSNELLSHLPPSLPQVYTHHHLLNSGSASASGSGYDRHNETRRHLQELAQEQYRQNNQLPLDGDSDIEISTDDDDQRGEEQEFDQAQYHFETLQEPFEYIPRSQYYYSTAASHRSGREPKAATARRHSQRRRPVADNTATGEALQAQPLGEQEFRQTQRRTQTPTRPRPTLSPLVIPPRSSPITTTTTTTTTTQPSHSQSIPSVTKTKKTRVSSKRSLSYFSRLVKRLSRLSCTCGSSSSLSKQSPLKKSALVRSTRSRSSIHLPPQLTPIAHSIASSLSTDLSGPISSIYQHRPQHPGSKRRRQKKAAAAAAAAAVAASAAGTAPVGITSDPTDNISKGKATPLRQDNGKQRAESRSRTGSLLVVDEPRGRLPQQQQQQQQQQQRTYPRHKSSLSLSTIHTWCPYCYKTIPGQDQSDHHQRHQLHNLISPTRTPLRTGSGSSRSSSCSSRSHRRRSSSPYPSPQQQQQSLSPRQAQQQHRQRQRTRSSSLSLSGESYLSSDIETTPAGQATSNTPFTLVHPLPHLAGALTATTIVPAKGTIPPALAALTPTTVASTGAPPQRQLTLTLSSSTPSSPSSSLSSSLSSSSHLSPTPPQRTAPLPPHPQLVVSASTPTVSSASSSPSSSSSRASAVVVRRSKSARAHHHRLPPQESKLEVSGNRFLFVSALDPQPAQRLSTPVPDSSTIVAPPSSSFSSSPSSPSSPVVNFQVKNTPLLPLPSKPSTAKKRPLSWAFLSPSSFTQSFKNKQVKHSNNSKQESTTPTTTTTTATSNFPAGSQQTFTSGSTPLSPTSPTLAPSPPPLFIQFLRGLETNPWFSDPSTTNRISTIRDIYPHFGGGGGSGSGGVGVTSGNGLSNSHHLKGGSSSFDDPNNVYSSSASSPKRRSWTTFFPFRSRSRRSSMPAATLSAITSAGGGATGGAVVVGVPHIIPTSPSTSAIHQHNQYNHHQYQSQQLYPAPSPHPQPQQHQQLSQQQEQPQKKRSASVFKRFSAPAPARKVEVLTIHEQMALLPTTPTTSSSGHYYSPALEEASSMGYHQVSAAGRRSRNSVVFDANKPLPAIVAEEESGDEGAIGAAASPVSTVTASSTTASSNEQQLQQTPAAAFASSQGQSHPFSPALPTLSLPAAAPLSAPTPSQHQQQALLPARTGGSLQQQQSVVVKKHQRRMSFLPSSLMSSNLAKFISGTGNNNNNNNNINATSLATLLGSSSGGPTLLSSSSLTAAAGGVGGEIGVMNPGGASQGQGSMGGGGERGGGEQGATAATTTLSPSSLWSPTRSAVGEGESFQVDNTGILLLRHGRNTGSNNNTSSNSNTTATTTATMSGAALTIEQFKWSMICCCNEIKTRAYKHQRSLLDDTPATQGQPSSGQKQRPGHFQLPPLQPNSSNKKADKNKSRSSNGNNNGGNGSSNNAGSGSGHLSTGIHSQNTTAAIEAAAQESRATLQALLMVMTSSMSGTDKDMTTSSSSVLDSGAQAQTYRGSTVAGSGGSQNHPMYVGPGGPTGGVAKSATGAAPPMRSHYHPIQQLSRHSSHPSLSMSPTPVSGATSYSQQQQQQQPAIPLPLRNNKSQSGMSSTTATNPLVQATNAILNPLSLQELALLLAYLLSVAPEQWIPWHLYDFFIRPQGRKHRDLIEMLPTHSQRILKALLETVDALVEYATGVAILQQRNAHRYRLQQQQQSQQQSGKQQQQAALAHLRSRSEVDPGHSRNNGGYGVGGNPMLRPSGSSTLSLARALAILEPPFSAQELHQIQQQQQQKASLNAAIQGGDTVHQEIALRGRKRRAILDSLSGLVFRPRQSETHRASGAGGGSVGTMGTLIESPTDSGSGGLLAPEEKGAGGGGKGKAMRRRSFLGAATTTSSGTTAAVTAAPSPAAVALQLQMAEQEREAGHLAFENLVSAFEAEYVRPNPSALATIGVPGVGAGTCADVKAAASAGGAEASTESQDELPNVTLPQSLVDAGSIARTRSSNTSLGSQGVVGRPAAALPPTGLPLLQQQQQLPPRQARSLPTAVSTPLGTDLAAVRSLSLPPWRKKHHSALQLGQQLSPSLSTTMASQQEWLPQYPFQSQVQVQPQQPQQPQWSSPPVSAPASRSASAPSVVAPVLNRELTTSTNDAVKSPSEELPMNLQSPVPTPASASGSTITLPALKEAEFPVAPIVAGDNAVVSEYPLDIDADAGATVTVRARGGPEVVTAMAATLPRRTTSRRSSTKKKRPMSLDNTDNNNNNMVPLVRTRTLSGTISSTWTAWKDHLLVLEEEEYVLEDSSESVSIISSSSSSGESFSSGYSDAEDEGGEEGGEGGGHDNEHDADDRPTRDFDTQQRQQEGRRRRQKDGKDTVTPAVESEVEGGGRTNKSSGTFGDLRALAAAIAASQQQQQRTAGVRNSNNNTGGSSGGVV